MSRPGLAVIFDMNGVIVDDMAYHERAWREFFLRRGKCLAAEEFHTQLAGRNNSETLRYVLDPSLSAEECALLEAEKEALYRQAYESEMKLVPGLERFLTELADHGVPMAVATSAPPQNSRLVLDGLEIRRFFGAVVDASCIVRGKPYPDLFLAAAEALAADPAACIVFEDSLLGIEAAHRAGMKAIGVSTTHRGQALAGAELVIDDFTGFGIESLRAAAGQR